MDNFAVEFAKAFLWSRGKFLELMKIESTLGETFGRSSPRGHKQVPSHEAELVNQSGHVSALIHELFQRVSDSKSQQSDLKRRQQ